MVSGGGGGSSESGKFMIYGGGSGGGGDGEGRIMTVEELAVAAGAAAIAENAAIAVIAAIAVTARVAHRTCRAVQYRTHPACLPVSVAHRARRAGRRTLPHSP